MINYKKILGLLRHLFKKRVVLRSESYSSRLQLAGINPY